MTDLREVQISDKVIFWNIFQKYLYEMTNYYSMDMDESGNYVYRYFDQYFEESDRKALFIYHDGILSGFLMINNYSCLGEEIDYSIAEFTIFPGYRKCHFGMNTMQKIFELYRGKWEIKYSKENSVAEKFWIKVTEKYSPAVSSYDSTDTVLSFDVV